MRVQGLPFVGPAGRVLDAELERAGIDHSICFVTNAVKHFKFERRGKRYLLRIKDEEDNKAQWNAFLSDLRASYLNG